MPVTHSHHMLRKITVFSSLLILAVLVIGLNPTAAYATSWSPEDQCKYEGGTWDADKNTCTFTKHDVLSNYGIDAWNTAVDEYCGGKFTSKLIFHVGYFQRIQAATENDEPWFTTSVTCYALVFREARECKLVGLEDKSALGTSHNITATYKGYADYLRLWDGSQYYRLPVVPGSEHFAGNGRWTAEFATADPLTGAPYAPAGNYQARCFGSSGTAGGTAKLTLTP